ncbi:iron complex transport system ATP-binding protein [Sporobacter termitidis DSM 10068]|uniref:Iron complex transport system ATP-binding protein n=1 Tax=Sporobacter termitidis DSM 10068 TaxID=1123282 RepID=A0A1M5VHX7_9FIRM|nr:ABC transporter ATP-binding protein [Sporobacter termitidis]SHH74810.1 iron complex transport system ATP-binding protein [Sporobacter termitidis DSM 10068]
MELRCDGVSAALGGADIVKEISMRASANAFVGIIGPNGSGKSTLLKCIYRVLKPSGGTIYLDDSPLGALSYKESARKMAVVAQHNYYNFDFTVREVVMMGRAPHKKQMERDNAEDVEIVSDALRQVDMEAYGDRIFSTLSGGEQQRIILARALAQRTRCLILDEPTNHLDVKYQLQLLSLVKRMELTVVTALHDLNMAAMYCDYIYVLKNGRLCGSGTPQDILRRDFLKEVFDVDVKIIRDAQSGMLHILYLPPRPDKTEA